MSTQISYEEKKVSWCCFKFPLFLAVNGVAIYGLVASIVVLLASSSILISVSSQAEGNWTLIPVVDGLYAEMTKIGETLVKLNLTSTNTSEQQKNMFYAMNVTVIIASIVHLTYFCFLLKNNLTKDQDIVSLLIKLAAYTYAVGRILFCLQYGIVYIFHLGEKDKYQEFVIPFFVGIALIIVVLDIIMASLVIYGLWKSRIGFVKFFITYMISVFLLRLVIYCVFIILEKDKTLSVISLLTHVFMFTGSYSIFFLCHSFTGLQSPLNQPSLENENEDYDGDYAPVGGASSVRFDRPKINGLGAKILSIYASVSGWLRVEGSRYWGLILDGTLYLYNKPNDPIPVRTIILEDNQKTTKNNSICVTINSQKLNMNVLLDDESKIDEKIRKWNDAIDDCS